MPGRHFGQDLAKGLLFITDRVNITDKIMFITMDGAFNMAVMMQDFKHLLMARFIDFDSANQQIITEALENPTGEFDLTEHDPVNPSSQTPTQALQCDPVVITRNIANTIQSSQLRCEEFKEIITTGNCREHWLDAQQVSYQLAHLTLIRDSPTQWGSSYLMIE
ncbi:hypothetical protein JB92DRAFT_3132373 [Gautieria morchelliformis]|nr:hypothetical protein JB92DRAFT_3132373 [Gautieria morchelliformis]